MKTPETSSLFEKRINEKSGVEYYVLTKRVAPYQQGFYFVNNSLSNDGQYLWFYCAFPPVPINQRMLGVVDFEADDVYLLPETSGVGTSPYIDAETGDVYFITNKQLFRRGAAKNAKVEHLATINLPGIYASASHLTPSPDKTEFYVEARVDNHRFFVGSLNIKNGEFTKWAESDFMLNHSQFNPVNPNLSLCAYDYYTDIVTGENCCIPTDENGVYQRLWLIERNGKKTNFAPNNNYATHEWWSADGKKIYYVNHNGIQRINLETGEHENIHESDPWHAYSSKDESFYVFDEVVYDRFKVWYRGCPANVKFYNAKTDKEIEIVTRMPENEFTPDNQCNYHIDPHPRISENEKYVIFTTTELGQPDVAMVSVDHLLEKTK